MTLTTDKHARKCVPIATGFLDYFPDAVAAVAHLSFVGNEQHNPGSPLHWDRAKSTDEADALMRHFMQRGTRDEDGIRHSAKVAWRALALLQKEIEAETAAPAKEEGEFYANPDYLPAGASRGPFRTREECIDYIRRLNSGFSGDET